MNQPPYILALAILWCAACSAASSGAGDPQAPSVRRIRLYSSNQLPSCNFSELRRITASVGQGGQDRLRRAARGAGAQAVIEVRTVREPGAPGMGRRVVGWEGMAIRFVDPNCQT